MSIMKTIASIFSALLLVIGLTACGVFEGKYRYECQDPENWGTPKCTKPLCTSYCTEDLLGYDPTEVKEEISEMPEMLDEPQEETTSDIIEEPKSAPAPENVDEINQMVDDLSKGN
jgi:hypothetical protein